jgi:phosphoribosylformimino-5-aminoimidazole carboxamide ribotide isomerase
MKIIPAIDLYQNNCVRLTQGQFDHLTVYSNSPEITALEFQTMGATWLHIVDLDGAKTGEATNTASIKKILQTIRIPIQVGGGIRSLSRAEELLALGVSRIILGTAAIEQWDLLETLVSRYNNQIIVGIDAANGIVKTRGWQTSSFITSIELVKKLETIGVKTIVYTDIAKDGMLEGPNLEMYRQLKDRATIGIIASGGITTIADLQALGALGLEGAIVGKAHYEGKIDLKEAFQCLPNGSSPV